MQNIRAHVARHAKNVHHHLHKPVHVAIGWTSVLAAGLASVLIISNALAQEVPYQPSNTNNRGDFQYGGRQDHNGWEGGAANKDRVPCPPGGKNEGFDAGQKGEGQDGNYQRPPESTPHTNTTQPASPSLSAPGGVGVPTNSVGSGTVPLADTGSVRAQSVTDPSTNPCPPEQHGGRQDQNRDTQEQIDAGRFTMMKRGLSQFTKEVERVKRQVASLQKQKGVTASAELSQALAKLDELAAAVKDAQNADDLEALTFDIGQAMREAQDELHNVYRQAELQRFFVLADKELARVNKQYNTYAARVKKSDLDLTDALAALRAAIDKQAALLEQIKLDAKTNAEQAGQRLYEEFFAEMDSVREPAKVLEFALNLKSGISQIGRELQSTERTIKSLERKKADVAELKTLLAESKAQYAAIKKLAAAKPLPMDDIIDALEKLFDLREQTSDILQSLTGDTGFEKPSFKQNDSFDFHAPQGFDFGQ